MSYTLAPGESWTLESLVGTVTAALASTALVPTLVVRAPSGEIIAEVRAFEGFA